MKLRSKSEPTPRPRRHSGAMQSRGAPRVRGTPPPTVVDAAQVTPLTCQIPSSHILAFAVIESTSINDCLHPRLKARYASFSRQLTPSHTLTQVGAAEASATVSVAVADPTPTLVRRNANSPELAFSVPDSPEASTTSELGSPGSPHSDPPTSSASAQPPDPQPAQCKRIGCPCDSWNGKPNEYCCFTCRDGSKCERYEGKQIHRFGADTDTDYDTSTSDSPRSPEPPGSPKAAPAATLTSTPPQAQSLVAPLPHPRSFGFDRDHGFGDDRYAYDFNQGADMPHTKHYRPPTQEQHAHDQRTFQAHQAAQQQRQAALQLQAQRAAHQDAFMPEQTGGEGATQQPAPNCLETFGRNHVVTLDMLWEDYDGHIHLASFVVQDGATPTFPPKFDLHLVELIKDADTGDIFTTQDGMVAVRFCINDDSFLTPGPQNIIQWIHLDRLLRVPQHSQLNHNDLLYLYEHLPRPTFPDTRGPLEVPLPTVNEHTALDGYFLREHVLTPTGWRSGARVKQSANAVHFNDLSGGSFTVPLDRSNTSDGFQSSGYIIHKEFTEHVFAWGPFSTNYGYPFTYYFNTLHPTHWLLRDGFSYALHEDYDGDRGWFWAMSGSPVVNWKHIRDLVERGSVSIVASTENCPVRRGRALNPCVYDPDHSLITRARPSSRPQHTTSAGGATSARSSMPTLSNHLARLARQQTPRQFTFMKTGRNVQALSTPHTDAGFELLLESVTRSFPSADPVVINRIIHDYVSNTCGTCEGSTTPHLAAKGGYKCANTCGLDTLSERAVDMISSLALSNVVVDQDEEEDPRVSPQPPARANITHKSSDDEEEGDRKVSPPTTTTPVRSKRLVEKRKANTPSKPKQVKKPKPNSTSSLNKWQTRFPTPLDLSKLELKYNVKPNTFVFCAATNSYRAAHITSSSLEQGPVKGAFNVLYANSGQALAWGAPPSLLVPYEDMRNFHSTALKVPKGEERARLCKIARSLQSTVANAAPATKKHRSGHCIPEEGWSDDVIERIVLKYKRIHEAGADAEALDRWSEQHETNLRRSLRERDFTKFQNDAIDHILSEVLESAEVEEVKSTRTKETLFNLLRKAQSTYPHLTPEAILSKMITTLNLQEARKHPKLTHAHGCEYFNGGACGSQLPHPRTTACLPQLSSTTLGIYMSALRNHPGVPIEIVQATKSPTIVARISSYARHQASCGRTVEGCDPLFKPEADAIILWLIASMKEITVNSQADILELITTATCVAWLATVRDFARRGAGCLRLKRSQCMIFKTASGSLVGSIDCKQRKVTKSNPHALCPLDMNDPCASFVNIMKLQQLYENYGIDIAETFLFPLYTISKGAFILAPATKSNKLQIHTAATLQPLIDRAAKACQLGKKVSVKSLRSMNTMLGASAGLSEPRLNKLMSWTKTSSQAKSYCNMVRALAVPPASVTAEQLKALEHATCYDIATFAADQGQVWN